MARQRVVILADANSGKTFEFEHRVKRLRESGEAAFFAPIEELARASLDNVLGREDRLRLEAWRSSGQPGWFFLDSVDEAKLTHLSLDLALKAFERGLGAGYPHARVLLSCRGTDWGGESDLKRITTSLPSRRRPRPPGTPTKPCCAVRAARCRMVRSRSLSQRSL